MVMSLWAMRSFGNGDPIEGPYYDDDNGCDGVIGVGGR